MKKIGYIRMGLRKLNYIVSNLKFLVASRCVNLIFKSQNHLKDFKAPVILVKLIIKKFCIFSQFHNCSFHKYDKTLIILLMFL